MRVLHVCSELYPLLKTGGLADVTDALPRAQLQAGVDARLLLPAFPTLLAGIQNLNLVTHRETFAGHISLLYGEFQGVGVYLIDAPHLYGRSGSPYHDQYLNAYSDNFLRFGLLGWVACEIACGMDYFWRAEIIHAHDWHAGLSCAYLAARGHPARSVFTVHNLAYPGMFSAHHLHQLQLPGEFFNMHGLEFHGQISYLKAGLFYADHITTVSPTYAKEITRPEHGYGLAGLLWERQQQGRLSGILNGVDDTIWNPEHDSLIAEQYSAETLQNKKRNKAALQTAAGLSIQDDYPLFAIISRLTDQKGLDLVLQAIPSIVNQKAQLVVLGSGDSWLQHAFTSEATKHPGQVAVNIGYDEMYSHQIMAGADVIMVPSRFEPCGLTQLYGLKYGTLPLVRHTGGLADTVTDCALENLVDGSASGFVFYDCDVQALESAVRRTFALWSTSQVWQKIQRHTMSLDVSWRVAAQAYQSLYQHLL